MTRKQAYAFFGVAFFLGVAFLVAGVLGVVLVTRPDLVLPKTAGLSTTAGAWIFVRRFDVMKPGENLQPLVLQPSLAWEQPLF